MKIKSVDIRKIAKNSDSFCYDLPQIVFAGRSNVGKSSLLRALINRKKMVRVGHSPGLTQSINFYVINSQFYFVDLPGYGYAQASKASQDAWGRLIESYFQEAVNIRAVVFLLDVRRDISEKDWIFFEMLKSYHLPFMVIITKVDKVSKNEAFNKRMQTIKELDLKDNDCVLFSSYDGFGKDFVWKSIEDALKL